MMVTVKTICSTVSAEDYYEAKWMALDGFYQFIDEGDDYDLAAARFLDDLRETL